MVEAQQTMGGVFPGQITGGQLTVAPGVMPAQFDISTLLASIMPLIMLMMVMMMLMPMMKGMAGAFKAS